MLFFWNFPQPHKQAWCFGKRWRGCAAAVWGADVSPCMVVAGDLFTLTVDLTPSFGLNRGVNIKVCCSLGALVLSDLCFWGGNPEQDAKPRGCFPEVAQSRASNPHPQAPSVVYLKNSHPAPIGEGKRQNWSVRAQQASPFLHREHQPPPDPT